MTMNEWTVVKDIATFLVASTAALVAAFGYRKNAKTRRAEFLCQLHKAFFEEKTYKDVRRALDGTSGIAIAAFVAGESDEFTDFLNFFELVAYLRRQNNLSFEDVQSLLGYYLDLLNQDATLRQYIRDPRHGFEELNALLDIMIRKAAETGGHS
ncbi:hypothetical protein [Granulicella sibirica]|uniref:Uncharacterized protein n=1 Tax=Granulicella sibirica TaxID=2479048 RepID=A0A4Q0STR2_9BACT|nr:hypothetical protein [Granulicella sibirica]RXH54393.1 hypothetical protein GRAN_4689 [Granulicella sibirica]